MGAIGQTATLGASRIEAKPGAASGATLKTLSPTTKAQSHFVSITACPGRIANKLSLPALRDQGSRYRLIRTSFAGIPVQDMRIFLAIAALALIAPVAYFTQSNASSISGTVVRLDNGTPLAETSITLVLENNGRLQVQRSVSSDNSGRFELRDVAPGSYQLFISRRGFFAPRSHGLSNPSVVVELAVGSQSTAPLSIGMVPGGAIAGRILDPQGAPVPGASVSARTVAYRRGMRTLSVVASARSDDNGRYRLSGLERVNTTSMLKIAAAIRPGIPAPIIRTLQSSKPQRPCRSSPIASCPRSTFRCGGRRLFR